MSDQTNQAAVKAAISAEMRRRSMFKTREQRSEAAKKAWQTKLAKLAAKLETAATVQAEKANQ